MQKKTIATWLLAWCVVAVVYLIGLLNWSGDNFYANLERTNSLLGFFFAPVAVISAALAYIQWKIQRDNEVGYKEPQASDVAVPAVGFRPQELVIFETTKQTTILKATEKGLECHLDDLRPGRSGRKWRLAPDQVKDIIEKPESQIVITPDYREYTGLVTIGPRKNWLYSRRLFETPDELRKEIVLIGEAVFGKS